MLRKLLLPTLTVLGLFLGLVATATPAQAAPLPLPLPVVDMTAVVTASQVEGYRGNQPSIGDDASTVLVQQALNAKGFRNAVDGQYGRATTAAYIKYQRSLGYRGIDANGIPGPASLAKLGKGRFTVVNVIQIGSRKDKYGTKRVSTRTKRMLATADASVPWALKVSQGSYCILEKTGCAKASAGTHDCGGIIDLSVTGLSTSQRWRTVQAMRAAGFAAWWRTPSQCGGCWPNHIHAIAIGDTDLWQSNGKYGNRDQVADYYVGRNGLSGHAKDNTPAQYRAPFTTWERLLLTAR
jgi:hypothetical protein